MRTYKNFDELEVKNSLEHLMSVKEVRQVIGCGWQFVIRLIQDGKLNAFDITGRVVDRQHVEEHTYGLRVTPSSVRRYLDANKIQ